MKILIGYDDNLGLPDDFATAIGCETKAFHELGEMIQAFESQQLSAMFMPCGTLPYIKNYKIIAQAQFKEKNTLCSQFVSSQNITMSEIKNLILGRVNQYCTTSFWSPLVYLKQFFPQGTQFTFKDTNGFADLLYQTSINHVNASMVWDIFLEKDIDNAKKVHELFYKDDLPTPIIVALPHLDNSVVTKILSFQSRDENAFFKLFQAINVDAMNQFIDEMQQVKTFFNIHII